MEAGTRFLNSEIDKSLTSSDLLGCLKLSVEADRPKWFMRRLHGVYNRRRAHEELTAMGLK